MHWRRLHLLCFEIPIFFLLSFFLPFFLSFHLSLALYIYIHCEVIIWAKFGVFESYYLGQVRVIIWAKFVFSLYL